MTRETGLQMQFNHKVMEMALDAYRIAFDRSPSRPSCDQIAIEVTGMYKKMLIAMQEKDHD